jgi:toxin ParE1/3/4
VSGFDIARRALVDLQDIWEYIFGNSFDAAERVLEDFYRAFGQLAEMPRMGHKRADLTTRDVLFWSVHSYLVICRPSKPLRIVRVIHGKRNVRKLLKKR